MINNHHQNKQSVFSSQPHTSIVQILPTSARAPTGQRTNGYRPARQTHVIPLDVDSDISRDFARLTADPTGEWPGHPTQTVPRVTTNTRTRPDSVPTHIRPAESNPQRTTHQRQAATLVHFNSINQSAHRPNITRPDTETHIHASRPAPGRGEHVDPDNSRKAFTHPERPRGGVGQDKGVLTIDRLASHQPAAVQNGSRSPRTPTKSVCSQTQFVHKHTTVPLPLHVDPLLKAEVQRVAETEGLSVSRVGATALGEWVHQRLHDQHEALLYPTMRQLVRDENHALGNRLVFFQMRTAFAAEQTRILTTNILSRTLKQQGVPDEIFNTLVDKSSKMAKRNIIARTPELKSLMEEWWACLPEDIEQPRQKGEQA